jgi:hypothetical protein
VEREMGGDRDGLAKVFVAALLAAGPPGDVEEVVDEK